MKLAALFAFLISTIAQGSGYIGADGPTFTIDEGLRGKTYSLGLIVPKDRAKAKKKSLQDVRVDLPAKFSWQDKITPIRNQGNCGLCWAFSAQATIADVMKLHGKGSLDLSEQYMGACDKQSSGCNGGWYHSAFQLVKSGGNVLEASYPYRAADTNCPSNLPKIEKIVNWQELSGEVAAVEDIKKAVYLYGPISVAVAVAGNFQNYRSGIYNEGSAGQINHAVNIVGWDETTTPKHWIMRNSWGTSWGEQGFMRIAYGSRKIGYAATFVDFAGPVPHDDVTPDPTPSPTPSPEPTPQPCPDCPKCTFWQWLSDLF
jgi:C1A family cysteine protease